MSDEVPSPFNPDPFDEMVDKDSRSPFQPVHQQSSGQNPNPSTEEIPTLDSSDDIVLYLESRHFKAFFKRLWWPKTFTIGTILSIILYSFIALSKNETQISATIALILNIGICFVYPFMRTHFWWRRRKIGVSVRRGQAIITLYEPRSRLFGFKGDDEGVNFLLSGNVAIMLNQKTWAELYIFRKSAGGMIDTMLDQDRVLHNLRDIYRPDLLKNAIEEAMEIARSA